MSDARKLMKLLVENVLRHPHAYDWTLQGMGMLRTYLSKETRLHVWDNRYRVKDVSMLHTHPWDFSSYIAAGVMRQKRYYKHCTDSPLGGDLQYEQTIRCGAGGGLCGQPTPVKLWEGWDELYMEGQFYTQTADEVHQSMPEDGTVTLVTRNFKEDAEHALVYFEKVWGSAEPRPATGLEVMDITRFSLHKWFAPNPNYA